ncbi:hypothetical protein HMPREF0004_0920 [Achromobacter piechaudii ATCC 43553]|uniref:Thioredoxin domain-containing protein n=2 Tax=Achromobacter piechaudii TaxID=72556 RepID=D4X5V8_9BURK|nr:hypothetical protein [Achromobacter piechaudii]EFF77741.1 hypothetical protein HMPREF0004_0920 [Achromobacter piechaudii ATCC 43553]
MARDISSHPPARKRSLTPMVLVFLCSLAPIVAAFVVYMNPQWWPADSSNYGTLVSPQRPMPAANELKLTTLDGKPFDLQSLKGKWLLVAADGAACPESCARKLYITRNTHASQGKNVDRLARVWFITDNEPVPEKVLEAYQGTVMLRVNADQLAYYLLARDSAAGQPALQDPIWVIDPLGNLMMQYPAQADGVKVRKDISKLVYNSRIG